MQLTSYTFYCSQFEFNLAQMHKYTYSRSDGRVYDVSINC